MTPIRAYLNALAALLDGADELALGGALALLSQCYQSRHKLLLCGNGGSAATASHLVADFGKILTMEGPHPFRALALTDSLPTVTALGNDLAYADIFAFQVDQWADPGDVLIAISGSGNSENVLRAVHGARVHGCATIGMTGFDGGRLKGMVDLSLHVPSESMQRVEDMHMIMGHLLFDRLREACRRDLGTSL